MGYKLAEEAERYAPDSLTFRERYGLDVLAHAARDDDETRTCPPGFANDPDIMQRLRLSRTCFYDVLRALVKKGALIHVNSGHKGRTAVYRIARFDQGAGNVDSDSADRVREMESEGAGSAVIGSGSDGYRVREMESEGAGSAVIGSGSDGYRVRESRTPIQSSRYQDPDQILAIVKDEIKKATGESITDDCAAGIRSDLITASREPVKNPAAYIRKAIRDESDPRSRWFPRATQAQPPAFKRGEEKGADPEHIGNILNANPRIREMRLMRQSGETEQTEGAEAAT